MKMKLVVLAGAKQGTVIPLKKDEFVIGRAPACTLRAGSEAISRRHCAIFRRSDGFVARDLGSRNGTYVNDERIEGDVLLKDGDELRVGPLKFRAEAAEKRAAKPPAEPAAPSSEVQQHDLKRDKAPPVKDVADVAERVAGSTENDDYEDDISRWLLGKDPGDKAMRETQTLQIDETKAIQALEEESEEDSEQAEDSALEANGEAEDPTSSSSSRWKIFGRGKGKESRKAKPGKLPKLPDKDTAKDSREAAADVLREMTRRR